MDSFTKKIIIVIRHIPPGKVMSYGQVAAYVGAPRAARQVGWTLRSLHNIELPWWRVLNNTGKITIIGADFHMNEIQKKLLEADGIIVSSDFTLDMQKYRFLPDMQFLKEIGLSEDYTATVKGKYTEKNKEDLQMPLFTSTASAE